MHVLKLFNFSVKSTCLATDSPKRSDIQEKKNELNVHHLHGFNETDELNEHLTICFFYRIFVITALLGTVKYYLKGIRERGDRTQIGFYSQKLFSCELSCTSVFRLVHLSC